MADGDELGFDALSNMVVKPQDFDHNDVDLHALGQAIDTTWGRSSTPKTTQNSVKFVVEGNVLIASYVAIVTFGSERQMIETKRRYADESTRTINAHVSAVKNRYKNLAGSALKAKEIGTSDSLEIISTNFYNPCRSAYYRRKTTFELA